MTDNEIIKALERCPQHTECCYCNSLEECGNKRILTTSVLELINRQKAEIERLSRPCFVLNHNPLSDKEMKKALKENSMTIVPVDNYTIKRIDEEGIRAEAIKEFAERLKEKSEHFWEEKENFVSEEDIDNLVKEMTEVQE